MTAVITARSKGVCFIKGLSGSSNDRLMFVEEFNGDLADYAARFKLEKIIKNIPDVYTVEQLNDRTWRITRTINKHHKNFTTIGILIF